MGRPISSIGCCRKWQTMTADDALVEVRRRFRVAPEKVFAAFAEARWVRRWLSPSPDITLALLQFDFREGGAYRFVYHVPGGQITTVRGTYRLIEAPSKIVFSWLIEPPDEHAGLESEVTVTITPYGEVTELIIRHERLMRPGAKVRHAAGWRGALEQLGALLEPGARRARTKGRGK